MKFIDFIQSMYDEKQLQLNKRNSPWLVEKIHLNLEFGIGKSLKIWVSCTLKTKTAKWGKLISE